MELDADVVAYRGPALGLDEDQRQEQVDARCRNGGVSEDMERGRVHDLDIGRGNAEPEKEGDRCHQSHGDVVRLAPCALLLEAGKSLASSSLRFAST